MPHLFDIVAYTYRADLYCPECIVDVAGGILGRESAFHLDSTESRLNALAKARGIDREDEATFDSDDFPKVVFRDQVEDENRCGECGCELD